MFKELFTEDTDRGVSPVIGVILMVAITVILAAVIGAFVLGLGDQVSNSAPQASFEFDFDDDYNFTVTHGGGEDIDANTIDVTVGDLTVYNESTLVTKYTNTSAGYGNNGWSDPISTGDDLAIEMDQGNVTTDDTTGETIRIVWNNPSGGSSNVIGERDWPN